MSQRIILFSSFKLQSINLFENFPKDSSITVSWVSDAQVPIAFANSTTSLDTIFSMSQMGEKTVTPDQKWLLIGESRVAPIRIIVTISPSPQNVKGLPRWGFLTLIVFGICCLIVVILLAVKYFVAERGPESDFQKHNFDRVPESVQYIPEFQKYPLESHSTVHNHKFSKRK